MWSGLGYYSRGRRLFEGAKKVRFELNYIFINTCIYRSSFYSFALFSEFLLVILPVSLHQ